jgi:hypothetical protein
MLDGEVKEATKKLLHRAGSEIAKIAIDKTAPIKSGDLRRETKADLSRIDNLEVSVGTSKMIDYAPHVHYGTGVYGKKQKTDYAQKRQSVKNAVRVSQIGQRAKAAPVS